MSATRLLALLLTLMLTLGTAAPVQAQTTPPAPPARLQFGDSGTRVSQLQSRLRSLGYWTGPVDGIFGTLTLQAVYAFQKA